MYNDNRQKLNENRHIRNTHTPDANVQNETTPVKVAIVDGKP